MVSRKRIALATGVGRTEGIGFQVGRQLADTGIQVFLSARDRNKVNLAEKPRKSGLEVLPLERDIDDAASIARAVQSFEARASALDIPVNNAAGTAEYGEKVSTAGMANSESAEFRGDPVFGLATGNAMGLHDGESRTQSSHGLSGR